MDISLGSFFSLFVKSVEDPSNLLSYTFLESSCDRMTTRCR